MDKELMLQILGAIDRASDAQLAYYRDNLATFIDRHRGTEAARDAKRLLAKVREEQATRDALTLLDRRKKAR